MKFVNWTPHDLNVRKKSGEMVVIPKSGIVARLETKKNVEAFGEFNLHKMEFGDIMVDNGGCSDLLEDTTWESRTVYVVSRMVKDNPQCKNDIRFMCPGELIRDEKGVVIGCDGFSV